MTETLLVGVASILVLGVAAEWLAWRLHLPSILLLLILGFVAGPGVTGLLHPDAMFGELLFPVVSIAVAIILFEGGLSLRLSELREIGRNVRNLVTIGVLTTWLLTAVAAYGLLDFDVSLATLVGAILVVTGPTVIVPLLRNLSLLGRTGSMLRWEAMLNDPIGAVLAVLAFETILAGGIQQAPSVAMLGLVRAALIGVVTAGLGAWLLIQVLRRRWVPEFLHSPVALMVVVTTFTIAHIYQSESGLLSATLLGVVMANQKSVGIRHIIEFKENLQVLLVSGLFIILASRLDLQDLGEIGGPELAFLAVVIFVVRPLAVYLSTLGSDLGWRRRAFLSWIGPRGIVAAAVASLFALELGSAGYPNADKLMPVVFLVIAGTVVLTGLTASPLARVLGLRSPDQRGVLIVGAHGWAREMAELLKDEGVRVQLVDTNFANVAAARMAGLPAHYGNAVTEHVPDDLDLLGIGRLMAMTPNDEVNSLAALHFADLFERTAVFQLVPEETDSVSRRAIPEHLRGRLLFDPKATYNYLDSRIDAGAIIKKTRLTPEFDYHDFRQLYANSIPLFSFGETGELTIVAVDEATTPKPGQTLIAIVDPLEGEDEGVEATRAEATPR